FAALILTGAALATIAAARPEIEGAVLLGVLLGSTALALGGLLVLAFGHGDAIQSADTQSPARYQGLGGNPNTAAMLLALGVPLSLWVLLEARRLVVRALAGAALALLVGSIVASGSSGRSQAWGGALHTAAQRPVAGYGFGTEEHAFVDRYYTFDSGRPENSYIGALLQLGVAGLVLLLALPAWALWRYARRRYDPA